LRIFAAVCGLVMSFIAAPVLAQTERLDQSCSQVNFAYAETRSTRIYTDKFYDVLPDGTLKQIAEARYDRFLGFYRESGQAEWTRVDRNKWTASDRSGPKFRSCVLVDQKVEKGKTIQHFSASWYQHPEAANADIWISAEDGRFTQVKRQSKEPDQFSFGTTSGIVLEIFDYPADPEALQRKVEPLPKSYPTVVEEDMSCSEVDHAYAATRSTASYTAKLNDLLPDGSQKLIADMRFDLTGARYRSAGQSTWQDMKLEEWSAFGGFHPTFRSCVLVDETEEQGRRIRHFTTIPYQRSDGASAEVWISADDRRFIRIKRTFENPGEFKFGTATGTVLEIFDYADGRDVLIFSADPEASTLDLSCAEVNRVYAATRASPFYSEKFYDVRSDGTHVQLAEQRFIDKMQYSRGVRTWRISPRMENPLTGDEGPRFRSCSLVAEQQDNGKTLRQYNGVWRQYDAIADVSVWLTSEDQRTIKVERRFRDAELANRRFNATNSTILEVFDYDPSRSVVPEGPF
jgi:hypothetical protein